MTIAEAQQSARRESTRPVPWPFYGLVVAAAAALFVMDLGSGISDEGLQLFARYTARLSFALFVPVFVVSSVASLTGWPAARALARQSRHLGLAFALAHFIHLGALTSFFVLTPEVAEPIAIIGGGFGYVLLGAMAITSTDAMMRRLGQNWKRLHTFGIYYLWFIFTQSYAGRVFASEVDPRVEASAAVVYVTLFSIALAALGLRLARRWAKR